MAATSCFDHNYTMLLLCGYCNQFYGSYLPNDLIKTLICYVQNPFLYAIIVISTQSLYIGLYSDHKPNKCLYNKSSKEFIYHKDWSNGCSRIRFRRIRNEQYRYILRLVADKINKLLNGLHIKSIIIGGTDCGVYGNFAQALIRSTYLDQNIKSLVIKVVSLSYGGKFGFDSIIESVIKPKDSQLIYDIMTVINNRYGEDEDGVDNGISIGVKQTLDAIKQKKMWLKYLVISSGLRYIIEVIDKETEMIINVKYAKNRRNVKKITNDNDEYLFNVVSFEQWFMIWCKENNIRLFIVGNNSLILKQFAKGFEGCVGINQININ